MTLRQPDQAANVPHAGWLAGLAWAGLEHLPQQADPLLHLARRWVLPFSRPLLPVERRSGATAAGENARLLVIGRGVPLEMVSRRLFTGAVKRERLPAVGLHRLERGANRALDQADLVVALVPRVLAPGVAGSTLLRVPAYLDFLLPTADHDLTCASQTLRAAVRAVRRGTLRPKLAHDLAGFEHFYRNYHLPMVAARFGSLGVRQPMRVLRRRFRFGGLMWAMQGDEPVAGVLFEKRANELMTLVYGRRVWGDRKLDKVVHVAADLFCLDQARRSGCDVLNFGGSSPVLTDGVTQHKRGWGAIAVPRQETHVALLFGWRDPNPVVMNFLAECPLVYHRAGGLAALAGVAHAARGDPREAASLWRRVLPRGVTGTTVLASGGWSAPERGTAMPPPDRLVLRTATSSAGVLADEPLP